MEYIGKRISIVEKENGEISIAIIAITERWKQAVLLLWMLAWSVSGVIVLTYYFQVKSADEKSALIVWFGFWAYFEYKVIKAFRWRKWGREIIRIKNRKLHYRRDIGGRGRTKTYEIDFIKNLGKHEANEPGFIRSMNNSYWIIAGETISFDYYGKEIKLGMQLEDKDSKELLRRLRVLLK